MSLGDDSVAGIFRRSSDFHGNAGLRRTRDPVFSCQHLAADHFLYSGSSPALRKRLRNLSVYEETAGLGAVSENSYDERYSYATDFDLMYPSGNYLRKLCKSATSETVFPVVAK